MVELLRFIEHCNSSHETIKFTFCYDFKTRAADFLDIHIWIDQEDWIQTDLYQKAGKKCQLLLPTSAHPVHCSNFIPYSTPYRLTRLCIMVTETELASWLEYQDLRHRRKPTIPSQLVSRLEDQLIYLKGWGYKQKSVLEQFQKALNIPRALALEKVVKSKKEDRIILSLPYDRRMPNGTSILNQHWSYLIKVNPDLKKVLRKPPMVSYTRPKSLRDILVRARLPGQSNKNNLRKRSGFKRCNMTRCDTSPYTKNVTTHTCNFTRKSYSIKEELSCFTLNTMYSITCTKGSGTFHKEAGKNLTSSQSTENLASDGHSTSTCPRAGEVKKMSCPTEGQYIGKSTQQFRVRSSQHRRSVKPFMGLIYVSTPGGYHFSQPGHDMHHMQFLAFGISEN